MSYKPKKLRPEGSRGQFALTPFGNYEVLEFPDGAFGVQFRGSLTHGDHEDEGAAWSWIQADYDRRYAEGGVAVSPGVERVLAVIEEFRDKTRVEAEEMREIGNVEYADGAEDLAAHYTDLIDYIRLIVPSGRGTLKENPPMSTEEIKGALRGYESAMGRDNPRRPKR